MAAPLTLSTCSQSPDPEETPPASACPALGHLSMQSLCLPQGGAPAAGRGLHREQSREQVRRFPQTDLPSTGTQTNAGSARRGFHHLLPPLPRTPSHSGPQGHAPQHRSQALQLPEPRELSASTASFGRQGNGDPGKVGTCPDAAATTKRLPEDSGTPGETRSLQDPVPQKWPPAHSPSQDTAPGQA